MKDKTAAVEKLLEKYRFTEEAEAGVRRHVLDNAGNSLRSTLQRMGRYNPLIGAVVLVFFLCKRLGIGLSMMQATAVTVATAAVVAGAVATGGYYGVKKIIIEPGQSIIEIENDEKVPALPIEDRVADVKKAGPEKEVIPDTPVISLQPFTMINVRDDSGTRLHQALQKALAEACGENCRVLDSTGQNTLVRGQLVANNGTITLFIRVMGRDGSILLARSIEAETPADMEGEMGKLARDIFQKMK